jgi:dihydrofolate reductase
MISSSTGTGSTRTSRPPSRSEALDIALIVAVARNGVIGRDGALPWRLSNDLRYFKSVTMGKPVIMGRKTYESIGRPLPRRANIVVSRNPGFSAGGVDVCDSLEAAIAQAESLGGDEAMIIGGAGLYRDALQVVSRIYLTEVDAEVDGDVRFPAFDRAVWTEISRVKQPATEKDELDHSFVVLERVTSA